MFLVGISEVSLMGENLRRFALGDLSLNGTMEAKVLIGWKVELTELLLQWIFFNFGTKLLVRFSPGIVGTIILSS